MYFVLYIILFYDNIISGFEHNYTVIVDKK